MDSVFAYSSAFAKVNDKVVVDKESQLAIRNNKGILIQRNKKSVKSKKFTIKSKSRRLKHSKSRR